MVLPHAMFQTITPVTCGTVHACVLESVDEGLAFGVAALRGVGGIRSSRTGCVCCWASDAVAPSATCPFAGAGTLVGGLGAVVETECVVAGVAVEGKEVELVAVGEFAVAPDRFDVSVHCGVGGG